MEENYEIWTEGRVTFGRDNQININEVDYAIVGGGITGITAAYFLSRLGFKVALFEKIELGAWSTCASTGFLTQMLDYQPDKYLDLLGLEKTKKIYQSHKDAIDSVEKIILEERVDCEFEKCPSYVYANNKREERRLSRLIEIYKKIGISAELKNNTFFKGNSYSYIELSGGAKFNPIKYIDSLAKIVENNGSYIFEHTKVKKVENFSDFAVVETKNGIRVKAKKVLMATASLSQLPNNHKHHISIYRTFVLEYELLNNDYNSALYEDIRTPYNYMRVDNVLNKKRLIIGGVDVLDVAISDRKYFFENERRYANKIFGNNLAKEIRCWSGSIDVPLDLIPHIGFEDNTNIFYAYGFGGNGLTYSMTAARIFVDSIEGKPSGYDKLFNYNER